MVRVNGRLAYRKTDGSSGGSIRIRSTDRAWHAGMGSNPVRPQSVERSYAVTDCPAWCPGISWSSGSDNSYTLCTAR